MTSDNMLTITEVADKLGVSVTTIKNYESSGILLPDRRLPGGKRFYSEEKVTEFYNSTIISKGVKK